MKLIETIKNFWHEVAIEMRKVSWPSKKQSWDSTLVVMVVMGLVTVYVGFSDLIFTEIMKFVYSF